MNRTGTLYFFCGKMASGKSTLAVQLATDNNAMLLSEDQMLAGLYPDEIVDVPEYIVRARKVGTVIQPVVEGMLSRGLSVVMDFPANTAGQRSWFRQIFESFEAINKYYQPVASDEQFAVIEHRR